MGNPTQILYMEQWYTPTEAAARLSANSGKQIEVSYVRTLARYGKIRRYPISARSSLYFKADVDTYLVEQRGVKSGRAKRQSTQKK